jgi:hypothetical protein
MEGHTFGPTRRLAFLLDFATYARFFVAVPLIFAAATACPMGSLMKSLDRWGCQFNVLAQHLINDSQHIGAGIWLL